MKKILLSSLLAISLFGHGDIPHDNVVSNDKNSKNYNFGLFFNAIYKNKDLYPTGITQSEGYENHGETQKVELEHFGLFANGNINNYIFDIELNRHVDAEKELNEVIEKFSLGYNYNSYSLKVGRDYNDVSFIDSKEWGYGFINMPLAIDSFFNGTLRGDGAFLAYDNNELRLSSDFSKNIYDNKNKLTFKASYDFGNIELLSYVQAREKFYSNKYYTTSTSSSGDSTYNPYAATHTHSHGTTETNTSSSDSDMNELSIENKSLVYGIGSKVDLDKFEIIAEYLNLHSTGDIEDAIYLIEHDTRVESVYVQLTSKNEKFNYGLRSEVFWYDKSLYGSGASTVAEEMGISPIKEKEKYLHTLDVNYKIDDKQKIFMDNSYSNYQTAIKFNYLFRFKL